MEMRETMTAEEKEELEAERFELAYERIAQMASESGDGVYQDYFRKMAEFVLLMKETWDFVGSGALRKASLEELKQHNRALYADILPENYEGSYANPSYAAECFGKPMGQLLSFLCAELRGMIAAAYERSLYGMVIRMELLLEVCQAFRCAAQEEAERTGAVLPQIGSKLPSVEEIREIAYWYVSDYYEPESYDKVAGMVCPERDFAARIVMESDLSDVRYLYNYGEYVSENEIRTAEHLSKLPEETIRLMADTYTEGYRIGFEVCNKDISIKKTVNIRYCLGFERMIRAAVLNFEKMGLKPTIYRSGVSIFQGRSVHKNGYFGANPNKQFDYDHREDSALFLDKKLVERKLECMQNAFEQFKEEAAVFGGPAVLEIFGEQPFVPQNREAACKLHEKQQKLSVEYAAKAGAMQNRYIRGEERSFTIIAFPVPEIGDRYDEIFDEIIRINTLDYQLYQGIQQTIIDTLDQGDHVLVKGMGENRTNLKIKLHTLNAPEKETNFENCVADVNIPVGEVFTSPQLAGTEGLLHVTRVFLNELEYRDLSIRFENGMVTEYDCGNFGSGQENKRYIKENVLFHHDTLPIGEFAIGTNTTAYVAAKKYGIEEKMPILIAEKTGPHFALGDTCYSHEEEVKSYNPDGKEIVAKENEVSALRGEDMEKAYFNCHTDITIPYDELGELSVVTKESEVIPVIIEGRFVLAGTEALNEAFESYFHIAH
ncbi:MAG: aminopeptidase [Blautia sp.]|nr:aminopeptidase [Blautia sp.]MCM1201014.1 aminopeptidase [Bacteroides fragilis]